MFSANGQGGNQTTNSKRPHNAKNAVPGESAVDAGRVGGRGLSLVGMYTDSVCYEYRQGAMRVLATLTLEEADVRHSQA